MGASDRAYFGWLAESLRSFEESTCTLAHAGTAFWVLGGCRPNPAIDYVESVTGGTARYFDKFEPDAEPLDFNALDSVPDRQCDVLMMTRASYLVEDPTEFLANVRRIVRPGGLFVVDWLSGAADHDAVGVFGVHVYAGRPYPFRTAFADVDVSGFDTLFRRDGDLRRQTGKHYRYTLTVLRPA